MPSVSSLEQAAAELRAASAEGRKLRLGTDLDAAGMDRVLEHEAGDLTCTVEAGIRLSALAAALAPFGQRLSLDPPGDPTIGACLAGNLSGPLRHRFGAPRDLVLGVTLVLADGTIVNAGGKVVKNVAGYDLGKLVCGSGGRLAFIGRVSLRLHPAPVAAATVRRRDRRSRLCHGDAPRLAARSERARRPPPRPGRRPVRGGCGGGRGSGRSHAGLVGGAEADDGVWAESRARQAASRGRESFAPGDLRAFLERVPEAVVRPSAGVAYLPDAVPDETPEPVRVLQERVRARFDPQGVLA